MEIYIKLIDMCACGIGNSSSYIREGAIIGVPAVNIGSRQQGRLRAKNIIDVDYDKDQILSAIKKQLENSKYEADDIYGDGKSGEKIAKILGDLDLAQVPIQKRLVY